MVHRCGSPVSKPRWNHSTRCADEPCVHDFGIDPTLRLLLDPVVADRRGRVDRLLDLARVVELVAVGGIAGPHAGEAVGLQLERDRVLVGACGILLLRPPHLRIDAEHVLDVMAVLVGDDVLGGEVAGRAELILQLSPGSRDRSTRDCRAGSRTARSAMTPDRTRCW